MNVFRLKKLSLSFGIILVFFFSIPIQAQTLSAVEILQRIDQNLSSESRVVNSKMIVHSRRTDRTIVSKTHAKGEDHSFTEYLAPAREKGTKMLKLGKKLWIYSPSTDRIIQISGHMLRQSVMGSDLSYEDLMDDKKLTTHYRAQVTRTDTLETRMCWILELTAKEADVSYYKRTLWVDKERFVPLRQELFAKSGTLLKRVDMNNYERIQGRWYPKKFIFKDMLKTGKGTEFIVNSIRFNVPIPGYIFSKAALRR